MAALSVPAAPSVEEMAYADRTIAARSGRPGALLGILEAIQEHHPHKYLSFRNPGIRRRKNRHPLAQIYSVVTFFALFNLEPQGQAHHLHLPRNGLPHPRIARPAGEPEPSNWGSTRKPTTGEKACVNTPDGHYSLRTVACFGQCALAPVVEVNHDVYGHMNEQTLQRELEHLGRERQRNDAHPGFRARSARFVEPAWRSCCLSARASPWGWAPAEPAMARKVSSTPLPSSSTSGAATSIWPAWAASVSARRSRW